MTREEVEAVGLDLAYVHWIGGMPERRFCGSLVDRLGEMGWGCRQEVGVGGRYVDIVAERGGTVLVIECKIANAERGIGQALDYASKLGYRLGCEVIPVVAGPVRAWRRGGTVVARQAGVVPWCCSTSERLSCLSHSPSLVIEGY